MFIRIVVKIMTTPQVLEKRLIIKCVKMSQVQVQKLGEKVQC